MDILIEYGRPAAITCKAFSYVSVCFTWSLNGAIINESDSRKFVTNQTDAHIYTSTLMIMNVHPANGGDYVCNATNREGSTLSNAATLSVIGKFILHVHLHYYAVVCKHTVHTYCIFTSTMSR